VPESALRVDVAGEEQLSRSEEFGGQEHLQGVEEIYETLIYHEGKASSWDR
jgi:hypothetical protein